MACAWNVLHCADRHCSNFGGGAERTSDVPDLLQASSDLCPRFQLFRDHHSSSRERINDLGESSPSSRHASRGNSSFPFHPVPLHRLDHLCSPHLKLRRLSYPTILCPTRRVGDSDWKTPLCVARRSPFNKCDWPQITEDPNDPLTGLATSRVVNGTGLMAPTIPGVACL